MTSKAEGRLNWFKLSDRAHLAKFGIWMVRVSAEPDDFGVDRWHADFTCEGMRLPVSTRSLDIMKRLALNAARVLVEQAAEALGPSKNDPL